MTTRVSAAGRRGYPLTCDAAGTIFIVMATNAKGELVVVRDEAGLPVSAAGPGLVDLQINGYAGVSFNDPADEITAEGVHRACEAMRRRGVVAILATLVTDAVDSMIAKAGRFARLRDADELIASTIAGLHIEGPMINPEDGPRGAHPAKHVIAPADAPSFFDDIQAASAGLVKILTLAPETPGAMGLIAHASAAGVTVALGHHNADAATIAQAVAAGAKMCTHLGNGSHAMLPRLDNYVQHQLADDRLAASFIADGHHIPFPALKNFLRAKGTQRSVLVTDALAAADGDPALAPEGVVRLKGTPYLAGSALTLDRAVLNAAEHCDVSFETAWAMASTQPAALAGLPTPETIQVDIGADGFTRRP